MVPVTAMYWWAIAGKNLFTDAACGRILKEEGLEGGAGGTRPCFCYILRNEALKSSWRWAGTLYAGMLFSVLNWEQQCMLMYSSKCLCIFLDWSKRFLFFLLSFFLFFFLFSVCLECHRCKDLLIKTAMCNFLILVYCFSFFEERWQKTNVKNDVFIKPKSNAVTLLEALNTQNCNTEMLQACVRFTVDSLPPLLWHIGKAS